MTGEKHFPRASVAFAALMAAVSACSDTSFTTAPRRANDGHESAARSIDTRSAVIVWNELARQLVLEHRTDPPMASRYYALLSVAQHEAVEELAVRSRRAEDRSQRRTWSRAIAVASSLVLMHAYPDRAEWIRNQLNASQVDETIAERVGLDAAERVLERARADRSDSEWTGTVPLGTGLWFSSVAPPVPPLRPRWGEVRPWLMKKGDELRPEPPPAFGSPKFREALAEVRRISDTRTAEQLRIALYWADGAGTTTPPGHWNAIAADLVEQHNLDERKAARVFALLNMAMMDAGIACWDAKYHYWLIRPPQGDAAITTPVGLPNFPSYISGHATFSGAASEVLGSIFPSEKKRLYAMAEEAAMSRLYGGIHYRFDNEVGLRVGRAIGRLATSADRYQ
jgi:membrane-associated phospholipid phosphatase